MSDIHILASILQGEAGSLGVPGMVFVAATIVARLNQGQTIARIDKEFYGNDADRGGCTEPGPDATQLATMIVAGQVPDLGYQFILSDQDVANERAKGYIVKVDYRLENVETHVGLNLVKAYWQ